MKTILFFVMLLIGGLVACQSSKEAASSDTSGVEISMEQQDSVEYELIVFDARFDTFLATQPYPKSFYSNDYYRSWNIQYCTEWNIRYQNPGRYGSFYETEIPYNASIDYGLDFNFTLYQYFQFIDKEYGIKLINRRGN